MATDFRFFADANDVSISDSQLASRRRPSLNERERNIPREFTPVESRTYHPLPAFERPSVQFHQSNIVSPFASPHRTFIDHTPQQSPTIQYDGRGSGDSRVPLAFGRGFGVWNNASYYHMTSPHSYQTVDHCSLPSDYSNTVGSTPLMNNSNTTAELVSLNRNTVNSASTNCNNKGTVGDNNGRRVYIDQIRDLDVLCGRGGRSNHHFGNKVYRQVVNDMKMNYRSINGKKGKTHLSRNIVDHVCNYGGRFVKRDDITGKYYLLSAAEARKKTSQALREIKTVKWTAC